MVKKVNKIELPSILSYSRSIQPSIGAFFYKKEDKKYPIKVEEITIKGVISDFKSGTGKNSKNLDMANIQKIEVSLLPSDVHTFFNSFSLSICNNLKEPNNINCKIYEEVLNNFYNECIDKKVFNILAKKYLENIVNGRWLWRNKNADNLSIKVKDDKKEANFNCNIDFEKDENFLYFADKIADVFNSTNNVYRLEIEASGFIGTGQEIFPSQEFSEKNNKVGRVLAKIYDYKGQNQAILHSQKIGNAIRTIDTWYDNDKNENLKPLPVEPFGVDSSKLNAVRKPSTKKDLYSYLLNLENITENLKTTENFELDIELKNKVLFVAACLIRGGLFQGESKKKESK